MKNISLIKGFQKLLYKQLNTEIEAYGYRYHFKSYMISLVVFLLAVFLAGYFYLLKPICMVILIGVGFFVFPLIIKAQFVHMYNNQRFENLVNYMEKMIIFFKQDPKILVCLQKTRHYVDEITQQAIDQAIHILMEDMSNERYDKALKIIEEEYHSARLISLHRFMKTVEEKSSQDYRVSLNNLDYDLKAWINRVYNYQTELKLKKMQVMVSLVASLILLAIFSVMWVKVDDLTKMISNPLYQIGALIFLITELILLTIVQMKINGQWLVEDYNRKNDKQIMRKIKNIEEYDYRLALKQQKMKFVLFGFLLLYALYIQQIMLVFFCIVVLVYLFYEPYYMYKLQRKSLSRAIELEFPLWLRDVALNLNNYVVVGAMRHSMEFVSPALYYYLDKFLLDIEQYPTSIEPFANFLSEYHLHDVHTAMLALYSLQEVDQKDSEREVTELIQRNQTMLSNGEKVRNQNALIGVLIVSFIPIILTMTKIIVDMLIMLVSIFAHMGG